MTGVRVQQDHYWSPSASARCSTPILCHAASATTQLSHHVTQDQVRITSQSTTPQAFRRLNHPRCGAAFTRLPLSLQPSHALESLKLECTRLLHPQRPIRTLLMRVLHAWSKVDITGRWCHSGLTEEITPLGLDSFAPAGSPVGVVVSFPPVS